MWENFVFWYSLCYFFAQNSMYVVSTLMLKVKYSVVTYVYLNNYNIV